MKKINYLFVLLFACSAIFILTQTFKFNPKTGDNAFDLKLNEINTKALSDINFFIERTSEVYVVDPNKVNEMLFTMEPADILICFQIQNITDNKLSEIIEQYNSSNDKSWDKILPNLGISKSTYEYIELKNLENFYEPYFINKNLSKVNK